MRRWAVALGLVVLVAAMVLGAGSASAGGNKKLVEGTVYDTTCAASCTPECPPPPHCGPVTQSNKAAVICAQQAKPAIVCPLYKTVVCVQAPCPGPGAYPVYSGEGAVVNVRRVGSATVIAQLPVVEGHFKTRLGPGKYVLHPILPEEQCWTRERGRIEVTARQQGPMSVSLDVSNSCVAHPDAPTP
jgi:hypothetical protein